MRCAKFFGHDEFVQRPAERLRTGVAKGFFRRRIELEDPALVVDRNDAVERVFEDRGVARFARAQLGLGALALGDVARDRGDRDHGAGGIGDRRQRERDIDARAVFPHSHGFKWQNPLALGDAAQSVQIFLQPVQRHDQLRTESAEGFGFRVAVERFGAAVPARDHPFEGLAHDSVFR